MAHAEFPGQRYWYLRACNHVGNNTRTFWRPHVENRGSISLGNRVRINSHWAPVELVTGCRGVIEIADGVYLNYGTLISAHGRVRIGADVMIGNYSIIADTEIPGIGEPLTAPPFEARDVEIGDCVWIAARVTILPGARIGAGAVIAAGSVVAGVIPAGSIVGGIPARILRSVTSPPADRPTYAQTPSSVSDDNPQLPRDGAGAMVAPLMRARRPQPALGQASLYLRETRPDLSGSRVHLSSRPIVSHLATGPDGVLEIGDDVSIAYGAAIAAFERVQIGEGTCIGPFAIIMDTNFHGAAADRAVEHDCRPVLIGKHCRIGSRVTITRGAAIGDGAEILAGSVVCSSIPAGACAGGARAQVLGRAGDPGSRWQGPAMEGVWRAATGEPGLSAQSVFDGAPRKRLSYLKSPRSFNDDNISRPQGE